MAGNFNVKVEDKQFEDLRKNIEAGLMPKFEKEMENGVASGALIVAKATRDKIHNITYKLSSSIGVKKFISKPGYVNVDSGYIKTDKFGPDKDRYFVYEEIGSSHQEPKHPLRDAKNENKNQVKKAVQEPLERFLRK